MKIQTVENNILTLLKIIVLKKMSFASKSLADKIWYTKKKKESAETGREGVRH